ncbi:MAG: bifunctional DNA primase/polymerase [Bifidobacteriaceae bacterium]|jgi:hypothetical protein|nr:bifunctional DNA primase/polymerase [Bifidobacteriaceae bacterium]
MRIGQVTAALSRAGALGLGEAAATLADAGVAVFPCLPGGKRPLTGRGFLDATSDAGQVESWWRVWPEANVAAPTGPVNGFDVVDVDVRGDASGFAALMRARDLGVADRPAALVRTPSGGAHHLHPTDLGAPARSWSCGAARVDFRGVGGYVVVPPSMGPRGRRPPAAYRLERVWPDAAPVDADRLRSILDPGRAALPAGSAGPRQARGQSDLTRLAAWVAARPVGERNSGLFWAACRLAEAGTGRPTAEAVLGAAAQRSGLTAAEAAAAIGSAYRRTRPAAGPVEPPSAVFGGSGRAGVGGLSL